MTSTRAATDRDLRRIERLAHLLDERFRIPGTGIRFGLDGLLGLIPGVGDVTTAGMSLYLVSRAWRFGLPARAKLRMLANVGIDLAVGSIPVLGDLFDVGFKANRKNARVLLQHLEKRVPPAGAARPAGGRVEGGGER